MSSRLVVLSDLHLAPKGPLCNFHAHDELAALLLRETRVDTTLVLNGDTFDMLQQLDRPSTLDLPMAPTRLKSFLSALRSDSDGRKVLNALGGLLKAGTACVLVPGNHDLELFHPRCREELLIALDLPVGLPNLSLHTSGEPFHEVVGEWQVTIGHGHRGDSWNDAVPATLHRALERGDRMTKLPVGSRLVIDVLQAFALAVDPATGATRFPFIELLKPELPAVPLLLLYLDRGLALSHLQTALGLAAGMLAVAVRKALTANKAALGQPSEAGESDLVDELADAFNDGLDEIQRESGRATAIQLADWLKGPQKQPGSGFLAEHSGIDRALIRGFLRRASNDGTFFDRSVTSGVDKAIIRQFLPEDNLKRVVIAGHTHAARDVRPKANQVYLNTGTWTDLMELPQLIDDSAVQRFIDALDAKNFVRDRHLTYAEVTPESGPRLWPEATHTAT